MGSRRDRKEIEVVAVPDKAAIAAAVLLSEVADYIVNQKPIASGQSWATETDHGLVACRAFETTSFGKPVLRLVDLTTEKLAEEPPRMALATCMLSKALRLEADGDSDAAREILMGAIAVFPGDPAAPEFRIPKSYMNQQNHLAYLALARLDEKAGERYYRMALERSKTLVNYELGAPSLPAVAREKLVTEAAALVHAAQSGKGGAPWGAKMKGVEDARGADIMGLLVSPILRPGSDGALYRQVNPATCWS